MDNENINEEYQHFMINEISCPITGLVFLDPVIVSDGHIYERHAIEIWLSTNDTSPITREIVEKKIVPAHSIKSIISKLLEQNPTLKKKQYEPSTIDHSTNNDTVKQIISTKKYQQLKFIKNFNVTLLTDTRLKCNNGSDGSMIFYIFNYAPIDIQKYVIDNCDTIGSNKMTNNGYTIIRHIIRYASLEIIKYVFDNRKVGIDIVVDSRNSRPIHVACKYRDDDIIKYLMSLDNIDLECETKKLHRPIHFLCMNKQITTSLLDFFIKNGVKMNVPSFGNNVPLHIICRNLDACTKFQDLQKIMIVIDNSKDLECKDDNGLGIIHKICKSKTPFKKDLIEYLVSKNINLNSKSNSNRYPIHYLSCNEITLVFYFINNGAIIEDYTDMQNDKNNTYDNENSDDSGNNNDSDSDNDRDSDSDNDSDD